MFRVAAKAFVFLLIACVPHMTAAQDKAAPPSFVPGEVVVKFRSDSKPAGLVNPKEETSEPTEALVSYLHSLSSELGIPIEPRRLGSGGSLLLSINQAELLARWSKRVRALETVKDVRLLLTEGPPAQPSLQVEFAKGSPEEKVLSQLAASGKETGPELQSINARLSHELGVPLMTTVSPFGRLQIRPDNRALTLDLVERLKKRNEIEYAQPNFTRGRMGTIEQQR